MDKQRAHEIIDSLAMTQVHYRGIPVFIQAVHHGEDTATVFPLDEMNHSQVVDLNGLNESLYRKNH